MGDWDHLAITYDDDGSKKLYVNGELAVGV